MFPREDWEGFSLLFGRVRTSKSHRVYYSVEHMCISVFVIWASTLCKFLFPLLRIKKLLLQLLQGKLELPTQKITRKTVINVEIVRLLLRRKDRGIEALNVSHANHGFTLRVKIVVRVSIKHSLRVIKVRLQFFIGFVVIATVLQLKSWEA